MAHWLHAWLLGHYALVHIRTNNGKNRLYRLPVVLLRLGVLWLPTCRHRVLPRLDRHVALHGSRTFHGQVWSMKNPINKALCTLIPLLLLAPSSADARLIGKKDGWLGGRKCYFSDGTVRKTNFLDDCLPHVQVTTYELLSEDKAKGVTMCSYQGGYYVFLRQDQTCDRYLDPQHPQSNQ